MVDQIAKIALRKSVRRSKVHDGYFEDEYTRFLKKSKEIIVLDVGGTKFHVLKSTFATWPTTRFYRVNIYLPTIYYLNLSHNYVLHLKECGLQ